MEQPRSLLLLNRYLTATAAYKVIVSRSGKYHAEFYSQINHNNGHVSVGKSLGAANFHATVRVPMVTP